MNINVTNRPKKRIPYLSDFTIGKTVSTEHKQFLEMILTNNFKFEGLGENKLFRIISILEYLELSTKEAVDELVWLIGGSKKLFNKYFVACNSNNNEYKVNEYVDYILKNELERHYKRSIHRVKLNVRFRGAYKLNTAEIAKYGNLRLLKYAHENGYKWDEVTCQYADGYGHLECLKYAHENGCQWDKLTCAYAAVGGNIECLKYAHENGCPWNGLTCAYAVEGGHLECLKYARVNGCPE
jgi:hypothetical protein